MFLFIDETLLFLWQVSLQIIVETLGLTNLLFTRDAAVYTNLNMLQVKLVAIAIPVLPNIFPL